MSVVTTEVKKALGLIVAEGGVAELRAFDVVRRSSWRPHMEYGYFDDLAQMAAAATSFVRAKGVYFVLNPIHPALLARAYNRLEMARGGAQTTSDRDIVKRRWLFVDCDAVRPSGISSSESEHEAALSRARAIAAGLSQLGWPDPIVADSGNGAHLLYRVDLPRDDEGLTERCLAALSREHSDAMVTIDEQVHNPARLCRLYGTVAAKGDNTSERPHRVSRILSTPEKIATVPEALLQALAGRGGVSTTRTATRTAHRRFDLDAWISKAGVDVVGPKPYGEGRRWIFKVCPWNSDHKNGSAFIIQLAGGAISAGCHHNSCKGKGWHDLRDAVEPGWRDASKTGRSRTAPGASTATAEPKPQPRVNEYAVTSHGLVRLKPTKDGCVSVALTNFVARIVGNVIEDDGVETSRSLEIEATSHEGRRGRFAVPAAQFSSMGWVVEQLGPRAVVNAGLGTKDHARCAIQVLSTDIAERRVYTHTGWRHDGDTSVYLHGGGGIGPQGPVSNIEVKLPQPLGRFALPQNVGNAELVAAIRASLGVLQVAPEATTGPLLCATFRAPLGPADFGIHIAGSTGAGKSELAALCQQHFGAGFDARHLPGSWSSTGNALEGLAFAAKDALIVVDDFAPAGTASDVQRLNREADRVLRGQGNNSSRLRMRSDGTLRPPRPPRGLVLSTGEDVPQGQSIRARLLILEIGPDEVHWERLTHLQRCGAEGVFAKAMAGFVRFLAAQWKPLQEEVRASAARLREDAARSGQHRRTPTIVTELFVGASIFLRFALQSGAITVAQEQALGQRIWRALGAAAAFQAQHQAASEPTRRFLDLVGAAVVAGQAHFGGPDDAQPDNPGAWGWRRRPTAIAGGIRIPDTWEPRGDRVGWVDGHDVYLHPEASYAAAQKMASASGETIPTSPRTLRRRMRERGLLADSDEGRQRLTVRRTFDGRRVAVLHLAPNALFLNTDRRGAAGATPDDPSTNGDGQGDARGAENVSWPTSSREKHNENR